MENSRSFWRGGTGMRREARARAARRGRADGTVCSRLVENIRHFNRNVVEIAPTLSVPCSFHQKVDLNDLGFVTDRLKAEERAAAQREEEQLLAEEQAR